MFKKQCILSVFRQNTNFIYKNKKCYVKFCGNTLVLCRGFCYNTTIYNAERSGACEEKMDMRSAGGGDADHHAPRHGDPDGGCKL